MNHILMYGKETVIFSDITSKLFRYITSKLFSEEKRLGGGRNFSPTEFALVAESKKKKKVKKVYWVCDVLVLYSTTSRLAMHARSPIRPSAVWPVVLPFFALCLFILFF